MSYSRSKAPRRALFTSILVIPEIATWVTQTGEKEVQEYVLDRVPVSGSCLLSKAPDTPKGRTVTVT